MNNFIIFKDKYDKYERLKLLRQLKSVGIKSVYIDEYISNILAEYPELDRVYKLDRANLKVNRHEAIRKLEGEINR